MIANTLRSMAAGLAAIVLSMTLAATPAIADEHSIFSAIPDFSNFEIVIAGENFPDDPSVTFDGAPANILGTPTDTEIVIELIPGTLAGSYRLTVGASDDDGDGDSDTDSDTDSDSNSDGVACFDGDVDCFEVTLGGIDPILECMAECVGTLIGGFDFDGCVTEVDAIFGISEGLAQTICEIGDSFANFDTACVITRCDVVEVNF